VLETVFWKADSERIIRLCGSNPFHWITNRRLSAYVKSFVQSGKAAAGNGNSWDYYSYRKAIEGFTETARLVGITHAAIATDASNNETVTNVGGSVAFTS
jgi:hypothetical protein